MKKHVKGAIIAAAAGALFLGGQALAEEGKTEAQVKCYGVNACKGQGQCASATHDCAGKNACKGKGWIKMSKAECDKKGGKVE